MLAPSSIAPLPGLIATAIGARNVVVPTALAPVAPVLPVHSVGIDSPNSDPAPVLDQTQNYDLTVTMTPSTATISAVAVMATATGSPVNIKPGDCQLLGSFAIFVQLALGALALLSLVYKRWRERPQRPVKIWFFDVSKQVFGSVLVHIANVFMSMLTSGRLSIKVMPEAAVVAVTTTGARLLLGRGEEYIPNPCSFYLLNLAIDVSTTGVGWLILGVALTVGRQHWEFPC